VWFLPLLSFISFLKKLLSSFPPPPPPPPVSSYDVLPAAYPVLKF